MLGFGQANGNAVMIRQQIKKRGIKNPRVIDAMMRTDRRQFVPEDQVDYAYEDRPVPLCAGATVSQPYMVGLMTDLLDVHPNHTVLEIGTGSGYQAAVLSLLAGKVTGIEVQEMLVEYASSRLSKLNRDNVKVIHGDGWQGFADEAPFDRILVTAAPGSVPDPLIDQLAAGGKMILPVGADRLQNLEIIEKLENGEIRREIHSMVQFVPLIQQEKSL